MLRRSTGKTTADLMAQQAHSSSRFSAWIALLPKYDRKALLYVGCYLLVAALLRMVPVLLYGFGAVIVAKYRTLPTLLKADLDVVVDLITPTASGVLMLATLYFWKVCLPKALSILFNATRFKKFGIIGAVHIVTCAVTVVMGVGILIAVSVFRLAVDPSSRYFMIMGLLGFTSMFSSFFLFHLLPKFEKKLFRRFFIGAMVGVTISFLEIVVYTQYQVNVEGSTSWIADVLMKYWSPLAFIASSVLLLANLIHCGDEVMEMIQRLTNAPMRSGTQRRSTMRDGLVTKNLARSFVHSDTISQFTNRSISYSNLQAHSMLEVGWAQIWLAGTELAVACIFFSASLTAVTKGSDAGIQEIVSLFSTADETAAATRTLAYRQALMNLGGGYAFYGGVVFPMSLVLKGKLTAASCRNLITLYSATFAALSLYITTLGMSFYYPIALAYSAFMTMGLVSVWKRGSSGADLKARCPVADKGGTKSGMRLCPMMN